jgi:hypothetical protein
MSEILIIRPEIATGDFLGIFLSASFILLFGLFYVAIFTLVKMGYLSRLYMPLAYAFWALQIYSTYFMTTRMHSEPFTQKVMMIAMVGYLILPHLFYYLYNMSVDRYENSNEGGQ